MEAKNKATQNDTAAIAASEPTVPLDGYVSPDVQAAEAGEQADFSMHVPITEDEVPADAVEPDPNA